MLDAATIFCDKTVLWLAFHDGGALETTGICVAHSFTFPLALIYRNFSHELANLECMFL